MEKQMDMRHNHERKREGFEEQQRMEIAAYYLEQQQRFLELSCQFHERVIAFQQWERSYINHLQHNAQRRRTSANGPCLRQPTSEQWPQPGVHEKCHITAVAEDRAPSDVTDEQWRQIAPLLLRHKRAGRPGADPRVTLNGILYVLHTKCAWRAIPARYGNNVTCWRRHFQWENDGTWERIQRVLDITTDITPTERAGSMRYGEPVAVVEAVGNLAPLERAFVTNSP
jgi:transposase